LRQALLLSGIGVIAGGVLAFSAGRILQSMLAGVQPGDASAFLGAAGLAVVMVSAGALLPALRALRVDPVETIRVD